MSCGKVSTAQAKRILEAVLLSATQPLSLSDLRKAFDNEISHDLLRALLNELRSEWEERSLELMPLASGWRFRTRAEFLPYLDRLNPENPRNIHVPYWKLWRLSPTGSR